MINVQAARSKQGMEAWFKDLAGSKPLALLSRKVNTYSIFFVINFVCSDWQSLKHQLSPPGSIPEYNLCATEPSCSETCRGSSSLLYVAENSAAYWLNQSPSVTQTSPFFFMHFFFTRPLLLSCCFGCLSIFTPSAQYLMMDTCTLQVTCDNSKRVVKLPTVRV